MVGQRKKRNESGSKGHVPKAGSSDLPVSTLKNLKKGFDP